MAAPGTGPISFFRGDTHSVDCTVKEVDPDDPSRKTLRVVDVTGSSCVLTVKASTAAGAVVLVSKAGGIINAPGTDGQIRITLEPADTENLTPGKFVYDVQVTLSGGEVYTVLKDEFEIRADVTT